VLEGDRLYSVEDGQVGRRVSLHSLHLRDGIARLVFDASRRVVWIVVTDAARTRMIELAERTLRLGRTVVWRQRVQDAVAYQGHLYLQSNTGVADVAPGATRPRLVPGLGTAIGHIAADPTRHRLIAIDQGYPTDLWAYRPGHRPVRARTSLDISRGTLAVVAGAIWVGGFSGSGGAVLDRLDPQTLRPVQRLDPRLFDTAPVIVGGGSRVVWVEVGAERLACIDASSGGVEQQWLQRGIVAVASSPTGALIVTTSGLIGLVLAGCEG
jgi:hypothetical protein